MEVCYARLKMTRYSWFISSELLNSGMAIQFLFICGIHFSGFSDVLFGYFTFCKTTIIYELDNGPFLLMK